MKKQHAFWFLIIFGLLTILPFLQQVFHPIKLAGLQGAYDKGNAPKLQLASWLKGDFQQQTDHYLKNNTGFNGELVRLRNQADYSFFGNINTNLTLGRANYIFDPNYIYAREGTDLLNDSIRIQKSILLSGGIFKLDSIGVPLLFCFAPNKANFYAEFLPTVSVESENTNQNYFNNLLFSKKVTVINYDSWFIGLKKESKYPLIPKYGAHWSIFGATLAADSLLKAIEKLKNKSFASFSINNVQLSTKPKFTDDDYLASLNLMTKWESPVMAYPELTFTEGEKPNLLIISDSFIWNFYDLEIVQHCFSQESSVWYYNKTEFDANKNNKGPLSGIVSLEDLKKRDAIIIIATGPSLNDFGYNFFEQLNQSGSNE